MKKNLVKNLEETLKEVSDLKVVDEGWQKIVLKANYKDTLIALKLIEVEFQDESNRKIFNDIALKRVEREIEIMENINHKNLSQKADLEPGFVGIKSKKFFIMEKSLLTE
ncbi:MAG: hypothetical protein ABEI53_02960 [Candidatus Magasanikbacteria bacterium]